MNDLRYQTEDMSFLPNVEDIYPFEDFDTLFNNADKEVGVLESPVQDNSLAPKEVRQKDNDQSKQSATVGEKGKTRKKRELISYENMTEEEIREAKKNRRRQQIAKASRLSRAKKKQEITDLKAENKQLRQKLETLTRHLQARGDVPLSVLSSPYLSKDAEILALREKVANYEQFMNNFKSFCESNDFKPNFARLPTATKPSSNKRQRLVSEVETSSTSINEMAKVFEKVKINVQPESKKVPGSPTNGKFSVTFSLPQDEFSDSEMDESGQMSGKFMDVMKKISDTKGFLSWFGMLSNIVKQ